QPITLAPTRAASTVEVIGLETEAIWKTVSASTAACVPAARTPKPARWTTRSRWTTAMARPGTPVFFRASRARCASRGKARGTWASVTSGPAARAPTGRERARRPARQPTVRGADREAGDMEQLRFLAERQGVDNQPGGPPSTGFRRTDTFFAPQ